jgi:hypothetical protein
MHKAIAGVALVLALALFAGPVAAESGVATLNAGQETVVATMTLNRGDVVEYAYSSGGSIEFAIARGGIDVYTTTAMVGTGTFTATEAGTYTFSFHNLGNNLNIASYDIKKKFDSTLLIVAGGVGAAAVAGIGGAVYMARKKKRTALPAQAYPQAYPQAYAQMPPQAPPPPQ